MYVLLCSTRERLFSHPKTTTDCNNQKGEKRAKQARGAAPEGRLLCRTCPDRVYRLAWERQQEGRGQPRTETRTLTHKKKKIRRFATRMLVRSRLVSTDCLTSYRQGSLVHPHQKCIRTRRLQRLRSGNGWGDRCLGRTTCAFSCTFTHAGLLAVHRHLPITIRREPRPLNRNPMEPSVGRPFQSTCTRLIGYHTHPSIMYHMLGRTQPAGGRRSIEGRVPGSMSGRDGGRRGERHGLSDRLWLVESTCQPIPDVETRSLLIPASRAFNYQITQPSSRRAA